MNFQTMNKQRKLILISAAIGVVSIFLPWFSAGAFGFSVHINGFHGWGILAFICFLGAAIISLAGQQNLSLDKGMWFATILCGSLALLSVIITLISSSSDSGDFGFASAGLGFGIWISLIASIAIMLCAWMFRNPADDLKSGFESIKNSVSATASSFSNNVNASSAASAASSNKIAELERLSKLKENGSITEEEFQQLKSKLL
jgi:putative oligomerization/nucleic acid binding protein